MNEPQKIMLRFSLIFVIGAVLIYFVMAGNRTPLPGNHHPIEMGMSDAQVKAFTEKLEQLKEQLADDKNNRETITQIANIYYDLDQYAEAISYYEQALTIEPDDPTVLADCGVMYFKAGDSDKALTYIDRAIILQPDLAQPWFNKGLILMAGKNEPMQAVETWRHYIELAPESEQAKFIQQQIDIVESSFRQDN